MLLPGQQSNLVVIAKIFDMLNQGYMQYLDVEVQALVSVRVSGQIFLWIIIFENQTYDLQ